MKRLKSLITTIGLALLVLSPVVVIAVPSTALAASSEAECEQRFLTFPVWYRGLTTIDAAGNCGVDLTKPGDFGAGITRIVLNGIEILLHIVAYAALFFIIAGGFMYMTAQGDPKQMENGKKSLTNAIIGLIISIASIAIVNVIFGIIG